MAMTIKIHMLTFNHLLNFSTYPHSPIQKYTNHWQRVMTKNCHYFYPIVQLINLEHLFIGKKNICIFALAIRGASHYNVPKHGGDTIG